MVSRQLAPRNIAYQIIALRIIDPGQLPPKKIAPRIINPWMIALGLLLPSNYPKDTFPLTISSWKLPPTKIAFWMICRLHICPLDKWLRGKLPHRKIVPMINYTWDSFYPRIRNRSTLTIIAPSCFFFLPKFFQVGHFSVLALALQFIQAVAWYNVQ